MVTLSRRSAVRTFTTPRTSLLSRITRAGRRTPQGAFVAVVAALMAIGAAETKAGVQACQPMWDSGFDIVLTPPPVGDPGMNDQINAMTVFDDGTGPALYAGGFFTTAGGVSANRIAKWDGAVWSPLGSGMDSTVKALIVFDDGTGPALYAGGAFTTAGGAAANFIAKWDGSTWSPLGSGMSNGVFALAVFDDGSGPALYAGGSFTTAGGAAASSIAKWDGSSWTPLGSGLNGQVLALTVFDDGAGPALYASGGFSTAGGVSASRIAKWDGTSWSPLGSGMNERVFALTVFDDGTGPALYAGGFFSTAGGVSAGRIAKWDGSTWAPLASGLGGGLQQVFALSVFDDGTGPALYAGGFFVLAGGVSANRIAKWDGSSWAPLGSGVVGGNVLALEVFDDGAGSALYAGGAFLTAGGATANRIGKWNGVAWADAQGSGVDGAINSLVAVKAQGVTELFATGDFISPSGALVSRGVGRFDGQQWRTLGGGVNSGGSVNDLTIFDDGSGEALYAGGSFSSVGGAPASDIAKWDGSFWNPLGTGVNAVVNAMAVFDDGNGPALYAGGDFSNAGGVLANRIARWDGQAWSALGQTGGGLGGAVVNALAVFDDGTGPALYVGGAFTSAGGDPAIQHLAKWDGAAWSALGAGVSGTVTALDVLDDGTGLALWVRGSFTTAGGQTAVHIAKWDGMAWNTLGGGVAGGANVNDLAIFDDGMGQAVYATGSFTSIGGAPASRIAKWDGAAWSQVGQIGLNNTGLSLVAFNDGVSPALYVGGMFTEAGGLVANRIARWDGLDWTFLDLGIGGGTGSGIGVNALAVFTGPTGLSLYAGGSFDSSGGLPASNFARWNGCAALNQADLNGDGVVNGSDLASLLIQWGTNGAADLNGDGTVNGSDLAILLINWGPV